MKLCIYGIYQNPLFHFIHLMHEYKMYNFEAENLTRDPILVKNNISKQLLK